MRLESVRPKLLAGIRWETVMQRNRETGVEREVSEDR
jgi:hypothetical protein